MRGAIEGASGGDTVVFDATLFGSPQTIEMNGEIPVNKALNINGPGVSVLTLDSKFSSRHFNVNPGAGNVNLSGMTLTRGFSAMDGQGGAIKVGTGILNASNLKVSNCGQPQSGIGGGIYNVATLNLTDSTIEDSRAFEGGGIYVESGATTTVVRSTISGNTAIRGGGVGNFGTLTVKNSTLSGNTATRPSNGGSPPVGGGIANFGSLTLHESTLSQNTAQLGGGLYNSRAGTSTGYSEVRNSTFANNSALQTGNGPTADGGGIYSDGDHTGGFTATVDAKSTTLSTNSAVNSGGGIFMRQVAGNSPFFNLQNSIAAGNSAGTAGPDVSGQIISYGYNLIGDTSGGSFAPNSPSLTGNILNPAGGARLAPFGDYGGPTRTFALLPNSPALDAGDPAIHTLHPTDQRGVSRPDGSNNDIGAFEERAITFERTTLPYGLPSAAYRYVIKAWRLNGAPATQFSLVPLAGQGLPPGLSLSADGTLQGTPTTLGQYTFTVKASDAEGLASHRQLNISIETTLPVFSVSDSAPFSAHNGRPVDGELDEGFVHHRFTITKATQEVPGFTSSVYFEAHDGTAKQADREYFDTKGTVDRDFYFRKGTVEFAPGENSKVIVVVSFGDTVYEDDETFTLRLSNPVNATIDRANGTGTIINDDPPPAFSISDVTKNEGDDGTTSFVFTVTKTGSELDSAVSFATTDGTATLADGDYVSTSGTLEFAPGEHEKMVTVQVNGDYKLEDDETFTLQLSNPVKATISRADGIGTIRNEDVPLALSINDVTEVEGDSGTTTFAFTIKRVGDRAVGVSVDFQTHDGTATVADGDYVSKSGTLEFAPGEHEKTVSVMVNGDLRPELHETFVLRLSNPVGVTISHADGTGTINNDDVPTATITVSEPVVEGGSTSFAGENSRLFYTFRLDGPTINPVTINFSVSGTATYKHDPYFGYVGSDYYVTGADAFDSSGGSVTIGAGGETATVTVWPQSDDLLEFHETVVFTLASGDGYRTGSPDSATGTILSMSFEWAVNTTADHDDGFCSSLDVGDCTLREAIRSANEESARGGSFIYFVGDAFPPFNGNPTINLTRALPDIKGYLNIWSRHVRVRRDKGGEYRILTIKSGARVWISYLIISNGLDVSGEGGGGIYNEGRLAINWCAITENVSKFSLNANRGLVENGIGGGIANFGTLRLYYSNVTGNAAVGGGNEYGSARGFGGGLYNSPGANLDVNGSNVRDNTAEAGGGIYNLGTLTVWETAVTGNAGAMGGGIYSDNSLSAVNSTISVNSGGITGNGSGVFNGVNGSTTFINVTVTQNGPHGGIENRGEFDLINTIVAGNVGGDVESAISPSGGEFTSRGHNLIGDATGSTGFADGVKGDKVGTEEAPLNAKLGPLAVNGAYLHAGIGHLTPTHALLDGSPAIDAGDDCVMTNSCVGISNIRLLGDQRIFGFGRQFMTVDIGAFESWPLPLSADTTITIAEDATHVFAPADFPFTDTLSAPGLMLGVIIETGPSRGELIAYPGDRFFAHKLGVGFYYNRFSVGDLETFGRLIFKPSADANGSSYATFEFAVVTTTNAAGPRTSKNYTFTINVTEVNDPPVAAPDPLTSVDEDSGPRTIPFADLLGNDSPGPANEGGQTLAVASVGNATGGTVQLEADGVRFTPAADFNGPASFEYTVSDNGTTNGAPDTKTATATASFTVNPVNDAPSFTKGADQTVDENAGAQTVDNWATDISAGPPDEAGQTLSFNVSVIATTGNLAFTAAPAVNAANGTLTFTPAPGTRGAATVSVTLSDDGGGTAPHVNTSAAQTFTITVGASVLNLSVRDAKAPEPVNGSADMVFTVALSSPATVAVSVNYATAHDAGGTDRANEESDYTGLIASNPATEGADYTATSGTLSFAAGEQIKTISVPILSDADSSETDETFLVELSMASGANIADGQATGTITAANAPGALLISELRHFGPGASNDAVDEFVEIYNNTDSPLTVAASDASGGFGLFKMGANCGATPVLVGTIPNGTVIPARGHFLFVGAAYSLAGYGGAGKASGDATLVADIEANRNVALFSTSDITAVSSVNRFDAVGFGANAGGVCDLLREGATQGALTTNLTMLGQHSYFRKQCDFAGGVGCQTPGRPKDTNDNSADFRFADAEAVDAGVDQQLGAPGPENLGSQVKMDATMAVSLLDGTKTSAMAPNRTRDLSASDPSTSSFGTLSIRRRVVNNTGGTVTRLRFRIVEITTFPSPVGVADLRAITSSQVVVSGVEDAATCAPNPVPCTVTVEGTTLEGPPAQPNGGGMNSTFSATLPGGGLPAGQSVNVQFILGVQQRGAFRFLFTIEALPLEKRAEQ